jgi:hypothetical protein
MDNDKTTYKIYNNILLFCDVIYENYRSQRVKLRVNNSLTNRDINKCNKIIIKISSTLQKYYLNVLIR